MLAKKEIARLTEMIKKYDDLIAREEKFLKLQEKTNAVVGADVTAKSGIVSHRPSEAVESNESMMRRLQKCELLHGMKFADEQIEQLSSNLYKYTATGFSGPVEFNICFEVDEPRDDDEVEYNRNVKTIDINFLEPFHKVEMSLWLPNCLRNNDLQTILRNIPVYGELYAARGNIIDVLEKSYSRFFTVDVRTDVGGVAITAHNEHRETYFEVEWKIIKYPRHQSLCHSLFFSVYDSFATPDLLGKCEDAFKSLAEDSVATFESLMANWETIVKVVFEASS